MKCVIAVVNQKGGVGKTTTSINLATGLALLNKPTLLIDMDPQAHSTIGVGIEPRGDRPGIQDVLSGGNITEAITKTQIDKLDLLPSHLRLDRVEQELVGAHFRESKLLKAISNLNHQFTVIDCRPTLGTLTVNALFASNLIVVPLDMTRYALDGLSDLMETINTVKNSEAVYDQTRLLLTKFHAGKTSSNEWFLEQLEEYKPIMLETIIRQDSSTEHAHKSETPVFLFKPGTRASEDYNKLSKEIINLCHQ